MNFTTENITYEKIPFEKVKEEIKNMFPNSMGDQWDLIPNDIGRLAESAGIKLSWRGIDWWTEFEYGNKEVGVDELFGLLFPDLISGSSEVIVVTDECFADKSAYQLSYDNLEKFCDTIYPDIHHMDFLQPHDFIFLFPQDKLLVVLHHEGLYTRLRSFGK